MDTPVAVGEYIICSMCAHMGYVGLLVPRNDTPFLCRCFSSVLFVHGAKVLVRY